MDQIVWTGYLYQILIHLKYDIVNATIPWRNDNRSNFKRLAD